MNPAGKQKVVFDQLRFLDPYCNGISCWGSNFKLHRSGGFLLHDDRSGGNAVTVADVPYSQAHQIARRKFAVQPQVKKRKLPRAVDQLQPYSDGSNVL